MIELVMESKMKLKYLNGNYMKVEGLSHSQLKAVLQSVYVLNVNDEYDSFDAMVENFADDDFYHLHYIAKKYLNQQEIFHSNLK
jgi:hypothetical protein